MNAQHAPTARSSRIIGGTLAAVVQLAIVTMVVMGFSPEMVRTGVQTALTSLDLRAPPPPPKPPPPPRRPAHAAAGRAAQANIRSQATAIVAPPVPALKPPPVPAATIPGAGVEMTAGAAPVRGPGSGAGGLGQGTGSGDSGDGESDGGRDAELISGHIKDTDMPTALREAPFSGTTRTELAIDGRGHVTACRILASSGNRMLDDLTCRLIFQRFRFRGARDAQGRPQSDAIDYDTEWSVGGQFSPDDPER